MLERLNHTLERYLPERRLFLRSDNSTRFVRLRPVAQAVILSGAGVYMAWSLIATSILFFEFVGTSDRREAARREQVYFETRLMELAEQRDQAAAEALAAHTRYAEAMDRVGAMHGQLLAAEQRNSELVHGIDGLQTSLSRLTDEHSAAIARLNDLEGTDANARLAQADARLAEVEQTLDYMLAALSQTATEREAMRAMADTTAIEAQHLALEYRLIQDRNERIFSQLEQALQVSIGPIERAFNQAGLPLDSILQQVRSGYQARSASLQPISISTTGTLGPDADTLRANTILSRLADIDAYRIALQRVPFARPVDRFRINSPFGMRRHPISGQTRMHTGIDLDGNRGDPIYATADGVVTFAGRQSGYGNIVIIQHDFGIRTRYAHLHRIRVSEGERVSRGDRVGDMGSTGASTGVHLHYEIRIGERAINPMTYVTAGNNVY